MENQIPSTETRKSSPSRAWYHYGRLKVRILILLCLLIITAVLIPKIAYVMTHETTDDAYLAGTILPVSAEVKGRVIRVSVEDNQLVVVGDHLFEIDPTDYRLSLESKQKALDTQKAELEKVKTAIDEAHKKVVAARATLTEAELREKFSAREKSRYAAMVESGIVSKSQYDYTRTQWKLAEAARKTAESSVAGTEAAVKTLEADKVAQESRIQEAAEAVRLAELDLSRTEVRATLAGRVTRKNVTVGKYVDVGQPLLAIVDTGDVWVAANYKENQISKIRAGQKADIKVDAYPGLTLRGHVDSLQAGTGSVFSLLPPENATGNFVKIVQRLPVKIVIDSPPDPAHPLLPGLSVVPSIDARKSDGAARPSSRHRT
jgi:membrane fusion protein (multidrug efflux system)